MVTRELRTQVFVNGFSPWSILLLVIMTSLSAEASDPTWTLPSPSPTKFKSNGSTGSQKHFSTPPCPLGYFECTINPSRCIPQSLICNGRSDCGPEDDSDESPTICQNIHEKDFWDSFYQKRPDADLERNATCKYEFSTIGGGIWAEEMKHLEMLEQCSCFGEKLFCQNIHHISTLLPIIPNEVEFLDLSGSKIDILEFSSKEFPSLETLILSSCSIREIPSGAFSGLKNLKILHLTGNHLQTLPNDAFRGNGNLQKLFLGYNEMERLPPNAFRGLSNLRDLDLRNNRLKGREVGVYRDLKSLRILQLSSNRIIKIGSKDHLLGLENLELLNLGKNEIDFLENCVFENLVSLRQLYLSWNKLEILTNETFCSLTSLVNLNLNGNGITKIHSHTFAYLENLESLNLERNRFGELEEARLIFQNLTKLQHIYFDQFWMCWWTPHVRNCEPKGDGISSAENLLDNILLRTCVWIMALLGVFGNGFVIASRLIFREKNRIHSFYIKNLALADLLMGIFLLSIAIHDVRFRGEFLAHQHFWRHSVVCKISGMLCALSSEASVLILTLITLDRYYSIVQPFAERYSLCPIAIGIIGILWSISLCLSCFPFWETVESYFGTEYYTSNGLCLPLQIHNPYDPGWEYSFLLFVVLNSLAFTFISYAYWRMLRIIQSSSTTLRTNQQRQDGILAMRFGLVVVTDFLCWAPVIFSKCLAMAGVSIPTTFYGWLAIFVLPVNSALNPILYTLTTKLFKQRLSKLSVGFRKRFQRGRLDDSSGFFYRATHRTTMTSMGNSGTSGRRGTATSLSGMGRRISTQTNAPAPIPMMQVGPVGAALKSIVNVATIHPINGCLRESRANSLSLTNQESEQKF